MTEASAGTSTFVLCIENNAIRAQALLLCESIRAFGGPHRTAPIVAIAPRAGLGVDRATRSRLEAMDVEYVEQPLNDVCPVYGSANRVFAAAWVEPRVQTEWIVVLDSDTVFLRELAFPADADVAVRPVDGKGSATTGPGDPFEDYWIRLAALQGTSLDRLPFVGTTFNNERVRASYNGGLIVVRTSLGLLAVWADLFRRSIEAGLKPWEGQGLNVHASTGLVGEEASAYWGSNQAALAVAMWSLTSRVLHYPDTYNVPLHLANRDADLKARLHSPSMVHVHYHWLFSDPHHHEALATLRDMGVSDDRLRWLSDRLPLR